MTISLLRCGSVACANYLLLGARRRTLLRLLLSNRNELSSHVRASWFSSHRHDYRLSREISGLVCSFISSLLYDFTQIFERAFNTLIFIYFADSYYFVSQSRHDNISSPRLQQREVRISLD